MKNFLSFSLFFLAQFAFGQVTCDPVFPTETDNVTIYFDAKQGNAALSSTAPPIYAHMGVITNLSTSNSDWKHVQTTWGVADAKGLMDVVSPGLYKKTFNIKTFFGIPAGETVLKLAFVFRNTAGSVVGRTADGGDIFYDVYPANAGLQTIFVQPTAKVFLANAGQNIPVKAAASKDAILQLLDNGTQIAAASAKTLETNLTAGAVGFHQVLFIATTATEADTSEFSYLVSAPVVTENLPAGTETGIQYLDNQTVRLSLYAPNKSVVHVIGDFNNWLPQPNFQMKRTPDGKTWWLEIGGLTPGKIYGFQYLVDGGLKIADPLSTLVLDPWNDGSIPAANFPNLPKYPSGKTFGIVSVLQTAQPVFDWQTTNYVRPKKASLIIYEMLLRDYLVEKNYQTLFDTLDYLQNLGVNAIELMPVNEFEGNLSWGYNPNFHKALDKFYGSPDAFKTFVDECHRRGIAVILDAVFNHATGQSPLAQLYWDAAKNQPATDNPWLNPTPKHDFNVFNDMNHESQATKDYMMNCVKYWLTEYRVDGFRFDLSKGFTQKLTIGNSAAMAANDPSRIAIWKNYSDKIWAISPDAYVILEHFADNTEETTLANYGMMLWGNLWGAYKDIALGNQSAPPSLTWIAHTTRGWAKPHVVGYMESHDEDRIGYECKTYGNSAVAGYNVKEKKIAMRRIEMLDALFYTVPGPKMLWEFGELGYDFSINTCTNGTINTNCRLDPKPIRWDYFQDNDRRRVYEVVRALTHLRKTTGLDDPTSFSVAGMGAAKIRKMNCNSPTYNMYVVANVGTTAEATSLLTATSGWWHEYFTGDSLQTTGGSPKQITLKAGEYRIYLDKKVALPAGVKQVLGQKTPSAVVDFQIFPNPSNGREVNLLFDLKETTRVRAALFDISGRQVSLFFDEKLAAGEQGVQIETDVPPGVYFVKISGENGVGLTKKLVVF